MKLTRVISGGVILMTVHLLNHSAHAALGGGADTIAADRTALKAVHRSTTAHSGYTVEEVVSDATTVREYVSPSGVVFGIAWNGYAHPDLAQLLGSYSSEYSAAQRKAVRKFGRKRLQLKTDSMVVEKWGHMRNLQGRAYVPGLVPAGVGIDEIK
jgi:hypothetical protein